MYQRYRLDVVGTQNVGLRYHADRALVIDNRQVPYAFGHHFQLCFLYQTVQFDTHRIRCHDSCDGITVGNTFGKYAYAEITVGHDAYKPLIVFYQQ